MSEQHIDLLIPLVSRRTSTLSTTSSGSAITWDAGLRLIEGPEAAEVRHQLSLRSRAAGCLGRFASWCSAALAPPPPEHSSLKRGGVVNALRPALHGLQQHLVLCTQEAEGWTKGALSAPLED